MLLSESDENLLKTLSSLKKEKLRSLIAKFPGLDAIALKGKGWRPQVHGSLRDAEKSGVLVYRNGGWFLAEGSNK